MRKLAILLVISSSIAARAQEPAEQAAVEPAAAEPAPDIEPAPTPAVDDFRNAWVSIGARFGAYVPGLFNAMDPHINPTIEVAVLLPFLERRLGIYFEGAWAPPGNGRTLSDPRVCATMAECTMPGSMGAWTYSMQTDELFFSLGAIFRFLPPGSFFTPYIAAAARIYFIKTTTQGTGAMQPFGVNTEQSTEGGFTVDLGGELRLGPGALLLDLGLGYSDLPHVITGATSTGALSAQIGYRLFL